MCALVIHKEKYPVNLLIDMFPNDKEMWELTKEQEKNLEAIISNTLTERHQNVISLRYKEGKTYAEIGKVEGVVATSIGEIVKRSVKRLGSDANKYLIVNGLDSKEELSANKGLITRCKVYETWEGKLDIEIYRDNKKYRVIYDAEKYLTYASLKEAIKDGFVLLHDADKKIFESFQKREINEIEKCTKLVYEANYEEETIYEDNLGAAGCKFFAKGKKKKQKMHEVDGTIIPLNKEGLPDFGAMGLTNRRDIFSIHPRVWSENFGAWVYTPDFIDFRFGFADLDEDRLKRNAGWRGMYVIKNKEVYVYMFD